MSLTIRPLREEDLAEARRILSLAFGTFIGLPDPTRFAHDQDYVRTRWSALESGAEHARDWVVPDAHAILTRLRDRGILLHVVFEVRELWWALGLNAIYLLVGYVTFSRFLASARVNGTLVQLGE